MRPVIVFLFLIATLAAQTGKLEGTVVDHASGQPIRGAHVTLLSGLAFVEGFDAAYGAITDHAGHFSIGDLAAGSYVVLVRGNGLVQFQTTSPIPVRMLSLKAGQQITDYKVEMTPQAVIAGRVVDDFGDPVQFASVRLRGVPPNQDPPSVSLNAVPYVTTDDRGEFRISIGPGRFHLQADSHISFGSPTEIRTDGTSSAPYVTTYFPNAVGQAEASVVEVGAGQTVAGLEIRLAHGPASVAHPLTISGTVTGAPEGERPTVMLSSGDSPTNLNSYFGHSVEADGKFVYPGQQPKFYRVYAYLATGKTRLQSPFVDLHLTSSDASGIQLALSPGEDLTGSVEFSGGTAGAAAPKVTVSLQSSGSYMGPPPDLSAQPAKDGVLRIPGVFAGRYILHVEPLPENGYIKAMSLDGKAVENKQIELASVRGSQLKIMIGLDGGQLSGTLLGHDGQPLVSPLAMLLVWTAPNQTTPDVTRITDGKYSLKGLRPGKIRVAVCDYTEIMGMSQTMQDEKATEKLFLAASEEVEIKPGDHMVRDLKVIDKEKLDAKPQQ